MRDTTEHFNKARVLVVGDVMLDRYWWGNVSRISPEAPVPVVRLDRMTAAPGGAANVAANVRSIGGQVELIGVIGNDEAASLVKVELAKYQIQSGTLITSGHRRTNVKTRVVAHAQQVARIDIEDIFPLGDSEAASVLEAYHECLERNDIVLLSDYAKGVLGAGLVEVMIDTAKRSGKQVLVDPKGKDFSKYRGASVLTPNRREAAEACRLEDRDHNVVSVSGGRLLSELDLENVVITESEDGMTLFERGGKVTHYDAHTHEVYDVTGAGDTVIACLAVALGSGLDISAACEIANIAGGLSVQQVGTSPVTVAMLRTELGEPTHSNQTAAG